MGHIQTFQTVWISLFIRADTLWNELTSVSPWLHPVNFSAASPEHPHECVYKQLLFQEMQTKLQSGAALTVNGPADTPGGQLQGVIDALQHGLQLLLLGDLWLGHLGHVQFLPFQLFWRATFRQRINAAGAVFHNSSFQREFTIDEISENGVDMIWYLWDICLPEDSFLPYQRASVGPVHRTGLQPDPSQWFSPRLEHHLSSQSTPTMAKLNTFVSILQMKIVVIDDVDVNGCCYSPLNKPKNGPNDG